MEDSFPGIWLGLRGMDFWLLVDELKDEVLVEGAESVGDECGDDEF